MEFIRRCFRPFVNGNNDNNDNRNANVVKYDGKMWHLDLGHHAFGEYSMAIIQANYNMEDQSQLESGPLRSIAGGPYGTFVGVYDGHGGTEASDFVNNSLFNNLKRLAAEHQEISGDVIKNAFLETDEDFLAMVRKEWMRNPEIASVGTCCLTGIICNGRLYIANAGDSRVLLGTVNREGSREMRAVQLTSDHNAKLVHEREELQTSHPHDSEIVVYKNKAWRVKGIIQVTRSFGDAYLKKPEFNREPLLPKFRVPEPFHEPILKAEPAVSVMRIQPEDQFLVFASDGLYEQLSNQEVVDIVKNKPRNGIARRLVKAAVSEAAKRRELRHSDLENISPGIRRHFHDDITVIVVFLDQFLINNGGSPSFELPFSIKGRTGNDTPLLVNEL